MAKYERRLTGDFSEVLHAIDEQVIRGSMSASVEDGSDYESNGVRCAVRVYERYSLLGSNRVSLNVTLIAAGESLFLSAITSGGSQAVFFKINTFGEGAFLDQVVKAVERYDKSR